MHDSLKFKPIAIGSLPHSDIKAAMAIVEKDFNEIPFLPQLVNVSKNEGMITQLLEGMPSFSCGDFKKFNNDYEEITKNINSPKLCNYAISENFSHALPYFYEIVKKDKPEYAKSQIAGPFTFACAIKASDKFADIITKFLCLKALWMIRFIKQASISTIPIIFIDEPSTALLGNCENLPFSQEQVVSMLRTIFDVIKQNGGISGFHCCGKCNWDVAFEAGADILNFDAYNYCENFVQYDKQINKFLQNGGKIAFGVVPTRDKSIISSLTLENLTEKFKNCVNHLTKKGINEKLILDGSIITSSCGAGFLEENQAKLTMDMVYELSVKLREIF